MPQRIIIVDDERDLREVFAEYLGRLGYETAAVADGAGLDLALAARPADLILLDLRLAGENGRAIMERVKRITISP